MSDPAAGPEASDLAVRELARDILREDEFSRWNTWDGQWLANVSQWLEEFLAWMASRALTDPLTYWLIIGGLLLFALALLGHVIWSLAVALRPGRGPAPRAAPRVRPRFAEEADELAQRGRFLDAAHRLLLGAIHLLVERCVLRLERHHPNRTLRHRLSASALGDREQREFLRLLDELEARWFGDGSADAALYEDWRSLYRQLDGVAHEAP